MNADSLPAGEPRIRHFLYYYVNGKRVMSFARDSEDIVALLIDAGLCRELTALDCVIAELRLEPKRRRETVPANASDPAHQASPEAK